MKFLKLLIPLLFAVGIVLFLALSQPAAAAPPDNPPGVTGSMAQDSGVNLEKKANTQTAELGQVVTYTVRVQNNSNRSIDFTLTDVLPEGLALALQTHVISATLGDFDSTDDTLSWQGSLPAGEEATLTYPAIPPSTAEPNQTLTNTAKLEFGETSLQASATITTTPKDLGVWGSFVNFIALSLVFLDSVLQSWGIPYSFGFAIILFTVAVRVATFPLNMQQIKSAKAMQDLQPRMKELQEKYKNDREKLAQEQMAMYKEAGVNPLGGCLPTLVQMPIWFALYQGLLQLSHEGLLYEGFFWIYSLAGPVADGGGGGFIPWLFPFVNGQPPVAGGWPAAIGYLVLPILLVVSQYYMQQMMTPPNPDPQQASLNSMMKIMPFMFGYFSLVVPSGLSLYWFTSNILALIQQYFTQTHLKPATAPAGAAISSPVPANPIPATSEETKKDVNGKAKRKSRRKR